MKIKKIKFQEAALSETETGAIPKKITVEMSLREAYIIGKVFGQLSPKLKVEQGLPDDDEIYDCLVGDCFNRYFEGGIDDVKEFI